MKIKGHHVALMQCLTSSHKGTDKNNYRLRLGSELLGTLRGVGDGGNTFSTVVRLTPHVQLGSFRAVGVTQVIKPHGANPGQC